MSLPDVMLVIKTILEQLDGIGEVAAAGVEVGPMTPEQQKTGCIEIVSVGKARNEMYAPLLRQSAQLNCYHESEYQLTQVCNLVSLLHGRGRQVVSLPDSGGTYLVHWTQVSGGPTAAVTETQDARQAVMFLDVMVGTVSLEEVA